MPCPIFVTTALGPLLVYSSANNSVSTPCAPRPGHKYMPEMICHVPTLASDLKVKSLRQCIDACTPMFACSLTDVYCCPWNLSLICCRSHETGACLLIPGVTDGVCIPCNRWSELRCRIRYWQVRLTHSLSLQAHVKSQVRVSL